MCFLSAGRFVSVTALRSDLFSTTTSLIADYNFAPFTSDLQSVRAAGVQDDAWATNYLMIGCGSPLREKIFDTVENFPRRTCRMNDATKLAAVPHAMREPACELLHFSHAIGQIRSVYFLVVVRE
jgi:hypothetical protein